MVEAEEETEEQLTGCCIIPLEPGYFLDEICVFVEFVHTICQRNRVEGGER